MFKATYDSGEVISLRSKLWPQALKEATVTNPEIKGTLVKIEWVEED